MKLSILLQICRYRVSGFTISGVGEAVDKISVAFQSLLQSPITAVVHLMFGECVESFKLARANGAFEVCRFTRTRDPAVTISNFPSGWKARS